jgi:hypothetical protein
VTLGVDPEDRHRQADRPLDLLDMATAPCGPGWEAA